MIDNDLLNNLDKIRTTELGVERVKKNLGLNTKEPSVNNLPICLVLLPSYCVNFSLNILIFAEKLPCMTTIILRQIRLIYFRTVPNDIIEWCKQKIKDANDITRKGKNWYVAVENSVITINAHSFTIITAHKIKK